MRHFWPTNLLEQSLFVAKNAKSGEASPRLHPQGLEFHIIFLQSYKPSDISQSGAWKRGAEDQPMPPNKGTIAEHKRQAQTITGMVEGTMSAGYSEWVGAVEG